MKKYSLYIVLIKLMGVAGQAFAASFIIVSENIKEKVYLLANDFINFTGEPVAPDANITNFKKIFSNLSFTASHRILPYYYRTDLSITIKDTTKKNRLLQNTLIFGRYNAADKENPFRAFFNIKNVGIRSCYPVLIIVPAFTSTWLLKRENYA